MDTMEFSEAESNTQDLMCVLKIFRPFAFSAWGWSRNSVLLTYILFRR